MSPSFKIRPGTVEDANSINTLREQAFADSPLFHALFPNGLSKKTSEQTFEAILKDFKDENVVHMVVEDTETGAVVSSSKWVVYKHERPESEWNTPRTPIVLESAHPELLDEMLGQMHDARLKNLQGHPYMLLARLETDPKYHRKGAASMLMDWGNAKADELGIVSYLEASKMGNPLYYRYGYREIGAIQVDLADYGQQGLFRDACMKRPARQL